MIVEIAESSSPEIARREKKESDTLVPSSPEMKLSRPKKKKDVAYPPKIKPSHAKDMDTTGSSSPEIARREKRETDILVPSSPEMKLSRPKKKKDVAYPPKIKPSHAKDMDTTGSSSPEMMLSRPKRAIKETKTYKVCSYTNSAFFMAFMKYFE